MESPRAHPLAHYAWSVLRDRSRIDRRLVLDALQQRLAPGQTTEKQEISAYALHAASDHYGGEPPSRRSYDSFRTGQAESKGWPSSTVIRNAYGSWNAAISAVFGSVAIADVTALRLTAVGSGYDEEELLPVIRAWGETVPTGQLSLRAFIRWCREQPEPPPPFARVPHSAEPIFRVFGSWGTALERLGLNDRRWTFGGGRRARAPRAGEDRFSAEYDLDSAPANSEPFKPEHLVEWLRFIAAPLSPTRARGLTTDQYEARRRSVISLGIQAGRDVQVPTARTICKYFGGLWTTAKHAAGLLGHGARPPASRGRYSDAELQAALAGAAAAGMVATMGAYKRWRDARIRAEGPHLRLPCVRVLRERLASDPRRWSSAVAAAAPATSAPDTSTQNVG